MADNGTTYAGYTASTGEGPSNQPQPHEIAAERTRRSVKSPRTPGAATKSLFALGATPLVMRDIGKDVGSRIQKYFNGK